MQKLSMPLWILGAWALLTFSAISNGYLLPIDETRYVGVALEMQQRGDPLVPQLNGEPYSHKPPMLFWAMQGGWAVFGVSAWWPRLVVSLFSIAAAVLTWQLMRRLWPDRKLATQLAPIILFGSLQWAAWTPIVMFDIVLTFWTLIAVAGVAIAGLQRPHIGWTITALGLGFSVLTKGPVALIFVVPLAVCAPLWHPGDIAKSHWYAGFVLSLTGATMIAMAWAWPAAVRGGSEYASAIFWSQSAGRMVNSFAHQRPIWWYLPLLFVLFFPWSCWATTWRALRNLLKEGERAARFLLCWALPPFLFLRFISGKQAHYLVPLAPPLAMLLARALDCGQRVRVWDWPSRLLLAVLPLSLAALSYVPHQFAKTPALPEWIGATPSWVPAGLLASAILMLWPYRQVRTTVMGLGTANVLLVVVVGSGFMRAAQPWYDLSNAAAILASAQAQGRPIAHQGDSDDRFRFAGAFESTDRRDSEIRHRHMELRSSEWLGRALLRRRTAATNARRGVPAKMARRRMAAYR